MQCSANFPRADRRPLPEGPFDLECTLPFNAARIASFEAMELGRISLGPDAAPEDIIQESIRLHGYLDKTPDKAAINAMSEEQQAALFRDLGVLIEYISPRKSLEEILEESMGKSPIRTITRNKYTSLTR